MARPFLQPETRRTLNEHDSKWHIKAILRLVATFFAFIAMILFAVSISISLKYFDLINGDWTDGLPLAPVMLSLLYNPAILLLTIYHRHGKPVHPGWNVAIDLIIWALCVPAVVLSVGEGWFWSWIPVQQQIDGFIPCDDIFNFFSEYCNPEIYTAGKTEIAGNVFLALLFFIHLYLFIAACIATKKYRAKAKRARTQRRNIELQYHRHPADHSVHQPPSYSPTSFDEDAQAKGDEREGKYV